MLSSAQGLVGQRKTATILLNTKQMRFSEFIDPLILPAVEILNEYGFDTFESCQGGEGHCYPEPTVRFFGDEFDLIRAYELCEKCNLAVLAAKRVFRKTTIYKDNGIPVGDIWDKPFNELTFVFHSKTGTIYLPD